MVDTTSLVKILIRVDPADWHSVESETLWATPIGPDLFRLENSPFYARGFSYLDIVLAHFDPSEGFPVAHSVVEPSGHSTYAIWVIAGVESSAEFARHWQLLSDIGCTFEGAQFKLLSVDVPPTTDVFEALRLMQQGEDAGVWYFQEQNYAHGNAA